MCDFSSLGLADWLVKQCKQMGINKPTPVQEHCMPPILDGKSLLNVHSKHLYSQPINL